MIKSFKICLVLLLAAITLQSEEAIYPEGYNIINEYIISDSVISISDTLVIKRIVKNDGDFPISGLSLSENIAREFNVISHAITLNEADIAYNYQHMSDIVIYGFDTHYWFVDDPDSTAGVQNELAPGDSLILTVRLTPDTTGIFSLPLHTTVFYGDNTGFFSADEVLAVTVQSAAIDTISPATIFDLR